MIEARLIAKLLLHEEAVFLRPNDPFTWTSGIKSPIYCDNRLLISKVKSRNVIIEAFCDGIRALEPEAIAGTATAGIPWAAWIASELQLPLVYVRSSAKEHGKQNTIEGTLEKGSKVILIEDLISTGKSSLAAAKRIQDSGAKLLGIWSIFNYFFPQTEALFKKDGIKVQSLTNFETLAEVAFSDSILNKSDLSTVLDWRKNVVLS